MAQSAQRFGERRQVAGLDRAGEKVAVTPDEFGEGAQRSGVAGCEAAHEQQPMFAHTPVVTVRSSIDALRLKLWDEDRGRLVRYPARRARSVAAADERALIPS